MFAIRKNDLYIYKRQLTFEIQKNQNSQLTNRLLQDVMHDYISNLEIPSKGEIEAKYTKVLHGMRMRARKLLQFAR